MVAKTFSVPFSLIKTNILNAKSERVHTNHAEVGASSIQGDSPVTAG